MSFYEEYKPFRNYMRRFGLVDSLVDIWRYSAHIIDNRPLPPVYAVGKPPFERIRHHVWPWDLDILAREIVLNAEARGSKSLRNWNHLADAVNHIRRLDDASYAAAGEDRDVLLELHRLAHRQFPWQMRIGVNPLMRAAKIFGREAVDTIVHGELGLTMRQVLLIGMGMFGHFQQSGILSNYDCSHLGIPRDAARAFFARLTSPIDPLRAQTLKQQSYGPNWLYAWNPLQATPLVSFDQNRPDYVICPIPRFVLNRSSTGIFYDIVNAPGFDNAFGESFQAYLGEVIQFACKPPRFSIVPEEPYHIGSKKFHGVDWIVSDDTGHLFIEAKTKRLTLGAKILSAGSALEQDLVTMATAIVQHYQNILRAIDGKTSWRPDGRPIYPMIITLEDWLIFSPRIAEILRKHVCRLLGEHNISEQVLAKMPFTVASAYEFEVAIQVISRVGVEALISKKIYGEERNWSLLPFMHKKFGDEMSNVNWTIFEEEWNRLLPHNAALRLS